LGFVIAALIVIIIAQGLAVRERRRKTRDSQIEEQAPEMADESGSDVDQKGPESRVNTSLEIGEEIGDKKAVM